MIQKTIKSQLSVFFFLLLFIASTNAYGQKVYVTSTGSKFHRSTCRYLRASKFETDENEIKMKGYTACKVCKPVLKDTSEKEEAVSTPQDKPVYASNRCKATTKSGNRCKRKTNNPSGKCWQHQ